jgi:hypothetical protein
MTKNIANKLKVFTLTTDVISIIQDGKLLSILFSTLKIITVNEIINKLVISIIETIILTKIILIITIQYSISIVFIVSSVSK